MEPFDVFLSHNSRDDAVVERLAAKLRESGVSPWLDSWNLTPGGDWQDEIDRALLGSKACAVFLGPNGLGDWSREELRLARDRAVKDRKFRLFSVLLPGAPDPIPSDALPPFLPLHTWVDLRRGLDDRHGFQALVNAVWGVPMGPPTPAELGQDVCPYRGLQTFDVNDAEFFFGREGDVQLCSNDSKRADSLLCWGALEVESRLSFAPACCRVSWTGGSREARPGRCRSSDLDHIP